MVKAPNFDVETAILDALDEKPVCTIKDIQSFIIRKTSQNIFEDNSSPVALPINYFSIRRILKRMEDKFLIKKLPNRGPKNEIYYTKNVFSNVTHLINYDGDLVALHEFIKEVSEWESPFIAPNAVDAIKTWILDILGSVLPEAYEAKNKPIPDREELKYKLQRTLTLIKEFHKFIKNFLDSDIWSDAAVERLAKEFRGPCSQAHMFIVDKSWITSLNAQSSQNSSDSK